MRILCGMSLLLVAGLIGTPAQADDVKSGPTDRIGGAFQVKAITGDKQGEQLCYV